MADLVGRLDPADRRAGHGPRRRLRPAPARRRWRRAGGRDGGEGRRPRSAEAAGRWWPSWRRRATGSASTTAPTPASAAAASTGSSRGSRSGSRSGPGTWPRATSPLVIRHRREKETVALAAGGGRVAAVLGRRPPTCWPRRPAARDARTVDVATWRRRSRRRSVGLRPAPRGGPRARRRGPPGPARRHRALPPAPRRLPGRWRRERTVADADRTDRAVAARSVIDGACGIAIILRLSIRDQYLVEAWAAAHAFALRGPGAEGRQMEPHGRGTSEEEVTAMTRGDDGSGRCAVTARSRRRGSTWSTWRSRDPADGVRRPRGRRGSRRAGRRHQDVSAALDEIDPIPGRYTLSVSSPGLERRLRTPAHFARAVGETVTVRIDAGHGRRAPPHRHAGCGGRRRAAR